MTFTVGGTDVDKVFLGSTPVDAVYLGADKVWPAGPPPIALPFTDEWDAAGKSSDPTDGQITHNFGRWYIHHISATGTDTAPTGLVATSPLFQATSITIDGTTYQITSMGNRHQAIYQVSVSPTSSDVFAGRRVPITWNP